MAYRIEALLVDDRSLTETTNRVLLRGHHSRP
jgi:hypothetical protein